MTKNEAPSLTKPLIEESKIVYDEFFKIKRDRLCLANSHTYDYYTLITREDAVIILAKTASGELVLTEEYRHPAKDVLLGAPGGYLESKEDPIEGARREFLEETGYDAEKFALMGSAYPYPGISSQKLHYVLAENAVLANLPRLDDSEIIRTVLMTEENLQQKVLDGCSVDGILCTALYLSKCFRKPPL